MKELLRKHKFIILITAAGAAGGFLYWKFVGCQTGSCPIKSVWYLSTLWGLAFGYLSGSLIMDLLTKFREKKKIAEDINPKQDY
jgi:hypothetical protein